jgi:hypothetical protein
MDDLTVVLIIMGAVVVALITFLLGRYMDMNQRIRWKRRFQRMDFGRLNIVSKDRGNIIKSAIVNFGAKEKERVVLEPKRFGKGDLIWIIDQGKIYREDDVHKSSALKIKYSEGIPVAFVDYDSLEALDFFEPKPGAKPDAAGSTLAAWLSNQRAKDIVSKGKSDQWEMIFKIVVICLLVACVYFAYSALDKAEKTATQVDEMHNKLINSTIVSGGDIIIGPTPTRGT